MATIRPVNNDDAARRLAEAVDARMSELGLTVVDLGRRSGVSEFTLRRIRSGVPVNYRSDVKQRLAEGLRWSPTSVDAILDGRDPVERSQVAGDGVDSIDLTGLTDADKLWLRGVVEGLRRARLS